MYMYMKHLKRWYMLLLAPSFSISPVPSLLLYSPSLLCHIPLPFFLPLSVLLSSPISFFDIFSLIYPSSLSLSLSLFSFPLLSTSLSLPVPHTLSLLYRSTIFLRFSHMSDAYQLLHLLYRILSQCEHVFFQLIQLSSMIALPYCDRLCDISAGTWHIEGWKVISSVGASSMG